MRAAQSYTRGDLETQITPGDSPVASSTPPFPHLRLGRSSGPRAQHVPHHSGGQLVAAQVHLLQFILIILFLKYNKNIIDKSRA